MQQFAPALHPLDLSAPGLPACRLSPFQDYLRHQLPRLRVSQRSTGRLLEVLLRLFAENALKSPRGALWAKPSQRRLGEMACHRWGDQGRRPLDRCTVNRLLRRLEALGLVRQTRRGKIGDREHPDGWRLANLVEPGPWLWHAWRRWCILVATQTRGFRQNALPETYRKVVAWAARHLNGVRSLSRDCAPPPGDSTERPRGEGKDGNPPPPRGHTDDRNHPPLTAAPPRWKFHGGIPYLIRPEGGSR